MNTEYSKAFEVIKNAKKIAIVGHIQPDGDALGCSLALRGFFNNKKVHSDVFFDSIIPPSFQFLVGCGSVISDVSVLDKPLDYDLLIIVDSSSEDRIGAFAKLRDFCKKVMHIDHHLNSDVQADYTVVVPSASSTGEIVYEIFKSGNAKITTDMANALYTAVSTDTGCFLYPSTTAKTHRIAADLIDLGAEIEKINYQSFRIYNRRVGAGIRQVLRGLRFACDGKISYVMLKNGRTDYNQDERHKIRKYVSDAEGVLASMFITNDKANEFHVRLSSHGNINVAEIAKKFNGGGHRNAAGFVINGKYKQVVKSILSELEKAIEKNN